MTRSVSIDPDEIELRVSRSSGPGGQHANTAETRVEAVFDVEASASLSVAQKRRVVSRAGAVLRAVAQDERSQARNRELAVERLVAKLAEALRVPRRRVATRPTAASRSDVSRRSAAVPGSSATARSLRTNDFVVNHHKVLTPTSWSRCSGAASAGRTSGRRRARRRRTCSAARICPRGGGGNGAPDRRARAGGGAWEDTPGASLPRLDPAAAARRSPHRAARPRRRARGRRGGGGARGDGEGEMAERRADRGRKVAGILLEAPRGVVVCGVGINVNQTMTAMPAETRTPAASS